MGLQKLGVPSASPPCAAFCYEQTAALIHLCHVSYHTASPAGASRHLPDHPSGIGRTGGL